MKISEVTTEDIIAYLRIDEASDVEISEIKRMKESAVSYMSNFTGLTEEQLNEHDDITQAFFILVADMFDNRNLYIEGKASNINKSVECILNMHSVNLV